MADFRKLSEQKIKEQYQLLKNYHKKYLEEKGVHLPKLHYRGNYTKDSLVLIALSLDYPDNNKVWSKEELTKFIRHYYPDVNDVQQARHLGAQKGWYVASGQRGDKIKDLRSGEYFLYTLEECYPKFKNQHRLKDIDNWEEVKEMYDFRCATCGSKEGEPNLHWPASITKLQKAHMDPNKPLKIGNIIPQCAQCNRGDRNRWVYDDKGRVVKLADPSFVVNFSENVQKEVYHVLKKKYSKK